MINILSAWFYIEKSQYVIGEHNDLVIRIKRGGCQQSTGTVKVGKDVNIYYSSISMYNQKFKDSLLPKKCMVIFQCFKNYILCVCEIQY